MRVHVMHRYTVMVMLAVLDPDNLEQNKRRFKRCSKVFG